jgi:hypothetical protein
MRSTVIVLFLIVIFLTGCQSYKKTEYYEDGQVKLEEERSGIPNWSEGKILNIQGAKM